MFALTEVLNVPKGQEEAFSGVLTHALMAFSKRIAGSEVFHEDNSGQIVLTLVAPSPAKAKILTHIITSYALNDKENYLCH